MDFLMNPENITLLIGALVALVGAIAFAIRQISLAVTSLIETRNKVTVMKAANERQKVEIERLKAEAETREQDGENERDTKIINILERLTDQNGRWPPIAEDFATAQNRNVEIIELFRQTNEKVAAGLSEMAKENKALRISMEGWAHAIDPNIEELSKKVEALESAIGQVITVVETGNGEHGDIRKALDGKVVPLLMDIHALVQPTPDDPTTKDKPAGGKILNADAGDHAAAKLPKTG